MTYDYPGKPRPSGTPQWANFGRTPTRKRFPMDELPSPMLEGAQVPSAFGPPTTANSAIAGQPYTPAPTANPWGDNSWFDKMNENPTYYSEWAPYIDLAKLWKAGDQGIRDIYGSMPQYTSARLSAINALGPGGAQGLVNAYRGRAMGAAGEAGRQNAATLRSMGITGQDAAAALDARNRASDATNDYDADINSPEKQAQRFMQMMQLSDPETVAPIMKLIQSLFGQSMVRTNQNNADHAARAQSSGLGGIVGNLLGAATGGGFGSLASIFGNRGGGDNVSGYLGHGINL